MYAHFMRFSKGIDGALSDIAVVRDDGAVEIGCD
jgi:hypothetical protein